MTIIFSQRTDAVGIRGMSSLQKVTDALKMLAYGTTDDAVDDYVRIGESAAKKNQESSLNQLLKSSELNI